MEKQKEMELELVEPENGTKLVPNKNEETDKSKDLFVLYVHTGCEEDRKYIRCCFSGKFNISRTLYGLCLWALWPLINIF